MEQYQLISLSRKDDLADPFRNELFREIRLHIEEMDLKSKSSGSTLMEI